MLGTWIKEVGRILLLQRFSKSGKVDLPLPDLPFLLLVIALIVLVNVLVRILILCGLLVSRAISSKVHRTSAEIATVVIIWIIRRLKI
jgi:hypothetical protein